ncbi:TetR/AcrR family transcriptional regulator [Telluria mixta]|uniref:TetR/AcrR family transcriptional regulator n=1 Tax=Telluria mixta TaxID=34071 RepID=A0ABT2BZF3_9BURK|nr:TetR/AcrR family transcriptional regulator [Telluria mixta]MCS0630513.1 TetR/AcrR family transcriptional regulator [Telluria mixta]WEM94182.1 TetR/AcrR family transcriptional regulator [Telluria mixta]
MTATDKPGGGKPRVRKSNLAGPVRGGLRAQGMRTRGAIVVAARQLLLEDGGLGFTLREIAGRAGISISNLQYYFPSRPAVLRAVFEPVIGAYLCDLRRAVEEGAAPRETLAALAARALCDAQDAERSALWCHFLALVAVDPGSARLLDAWYETLVHEIAVLVRAANPALGLDGSRSAAILAIALADGVCVRNGVGRKRQGCVHDLDAPFLAAVAYLLDGRPARS